MPLNFIYATAQQMVNREGPVVLPLAPSIPSSKEKIAYLNNEVLYFSVNEPYLFKNNIRLGVVLSSSVARQMGWTGGPLRHFAV